MAIEKNYVKAASVSRLDSEFSVGSRSQESMSSDDDELRRRNSIDSRDDDDDDDGYDDADSGAGSDDFDLLELGETNSEFCQVGDQTCCVPFELYDLPDLQGILSLESWNECLTDDERFSLSKYLPDLDQEMYMWTLKELFEGRNFHFGSPLTKLFQILKGGLCEPRVCLYRQGLSFFQRHKHYHLLRKHQGSMVASFLQMREAWQNCKGYSIEEKLRVLNIVKSQKSFMGERNGDVRSDSSGMEEAGEALCGMKSKGRATLKKGSHLDSLYGVNPAIEVFSQGRPVAINSAHSKKNSKGMLKMGGSKAPLLDQMASSHQHGFQSMKYDPYVADLVPPGGVKATTYDAMMARQMRKQMTGGDPERQMMYGIASQRDWNVVECNTMNQGRFAKSGKKYEVSRVGDYDAHSYSSFPLSANNCVPGHKRKPNINQLSDIKVLTSNPSNVRALYDLAKEKYLDPTYMGQVRPTKGPATGMVLKGNISDFPNADESYSSKNREGGRYFAEPSSFDCEDRDVSRRKLKIGREFPDSRLSYAQSSQLQMDDRIDRPKKQAKLLLDPVKGFAVRDGGPSMVPSNGGRLSGRGDETESDSSVEHEEEDDLPLIMTKLGARAHFQNNRSPSTSLFHHNEKRAKKVIKGNAPTVKEMLPVSSTIGDFGRHKQKSKMRHPNIIRNFSAGVPDDGQYSDYGITNTENSRKSTRRPGSNVQLQAELAENYSISMNKPSPVHRRQKGNAGLDFPLHQSKYLPDFMIEGNGGLFATGPVETGVGNLNIAVPDFSSALERQKENEPYMVIDGQGGSDCKQYHEEPFESIQLRKRIKRRAEADSGSRDAVAEEVPVMEVAVADVELEVKPKKKPFILITPTVHTDFSFSVVHLLSAVRMALITPNSVEDFSEPGKQCGTSDVKEDGDGNGKQCGTSDVKEQDRNGKQCETSDGSGNHESRNGSIKEPDVKDSPHDKITTPSLMPPDKTIPDSLTPLEKTTPPSLMPPDKTTTTSLPPSDKTTTTSLPPSDKITTPSLPPSDKTNNPSLTVQEIVNRVRSNPGDPSILETQEPLLDLVRGVMKIFSSRTAPLGAKGWKPLVCYEKGSKSWTWTGPVPLSSTDLEIPEEVLSPEAWGIPHKMLVKLVDSFANWLKSGQETLRQIGSLPAPPAELMQLNFDEKERFKDLRAQKSLSTISTSSEEVRAYFQKEEQLRYSIPDRAFSYTAADGKKSIVAPLRRCGGKPTSKARDHFMLKRDRPPHVTILCLVRDAAARLPGSIGTRADVCTLIRDSQFIVDDVSNEKVNQVVSGALDRLHYERDPCVQYDSERKLWVYLHRDREEEDFEDDGTSSTKKWKRPKKDASEPDDQVTVACHGNAGPSGPDADIHEKPLSAQNDKIAEVGCDDVRQKTEDDKAGDIHDDGAFQQMIENELECQENSANENLVYNT